MRNLRILMALLQKEVLLMRRNVLIPRVIFLMPLAVMLVMPLVATFDVEHVGVAVVDADNSQLSRRIVADMSASGWLTVDTVTASYPEAMQAMERGTADVIVALPRGLERSGGLLDVSGNGVDATKGVLGAQYAAQSALMTIDRWRAENGLPAAQDAAMSASASAHTRPEVLNMYNPTQNFRFYMIPALMCMLLIIICGFLPALNLVSEKETGTIEAMNVTPVGRMTFVLSKLIPFWVAGLVVMAAGMTTAWLVYGLRPEGSLGIILLAAVLFSLMMSGLGLAVANKSSTLMQSILVMYAVIMILQLMSGLFTPVSSMPHWAQLSTYLMPTRYFIDIMRAVYLKGSTVADLSSDFLLLALSAALSCLLAAVTYRKRS